MSRASNDRIAEHAFRPSLSRASRKTNDQPVSSAGTVLPHIFSQFCLTRGQSPGAAHSGGTPVWLSIRHCGWCSDRRRRRKFNRPFPASVAMTSDIRRCTGARATVSLHHPSGTGQRTGATQRRWTGGNQAQDPPWRDCTTRLVMSPLAFRLLRIELSLCGRRIHLSYVSSGS